MAKSKRRKPKFPPSVRRKCLLWCARHCCLCGKNCGLDIELHHLEENLPPREVNRIDNAMPVCYDCHADLERSKANSPRGSKYNIVELKARREQVYEEHTRHMVPIINYGPLNDPNMQFPNVRFHLHNTDGGLPVYAKCRVEIYVSRQLFGTPVRHYSGKKLWTCNPGLVALGWFSLGQGRHLQKDPNYQGPTPDQAQGKDVRLKVYLTIVDPFDREHDRLPVEWFYDWARAMWVYDP